MTKDEVIALMKSSESSKQWNINHARVKKLFNGDPDWWYQTMILSGMLDSLAKAWVSNEIKR